MTLAAKNVSAVVVTRGDVDMRPVLDSIVFRPVAVWDNSRAPVDLGAFGRYVAAAAAPTPWVYVQDDDCVVPPDAQLGLLAAYEGDVWVSNMNSRHNGGGMPHLALPGWGAVFLADLASVACRCWQAAEPADFMSDDWLRVGCDIVIPTLCESRMVDLGHEDLPHAHAASRTHLQPGYQAKKEWYYRRAAQLR